MQRLLYTLFLFCLFLYSSEVGAQSKLKTAANFVYLPEKNGDEYNQRVPHKTLPLNQNEFVILSRQASNAYSVEKYNASLKKSWSASIPLTETETVEAFYTSPVSAVVITLRKTDEKQLLHAHRISLQTGEKQSPVLLLEAPANGRRAGIAHSPDGSKLLAYRYHTDNNLQINDISGALFDVNLQKVTDRKYNLNDITGILTTEIKVSNTGEQYVCLISDNMNRLTVRQYTTGSPQATVMSVLVGGIYNGNKVYILDSRFELTPNNTLYGAVLTAEEETGRYYSLKAVKFDFEAKDMIFADEFKFTKAYVEKVVPPGKSNPEPRLEDIYLSDLLLSDNGKLTVIAEKKYTEGGEDAPYFAEDLHLFTYDEYMSTAWNAVVRKQQKAPADEAFSGISYRAKASDNTIHLLTLEDLNGKYDLYLRQIDSNSGQVTVAKPVGINVASDRNLAYVKDFTTWLTDKNLITVIRPSKKAEGLRLSHIQVK